MSAGSAARNPDLVQANRFRARRGWGQVDGTGNQRQSQEAFPARPRAFVISRGFYLRSVALGTSSFDRGKATPIDIESRTLLRHVDKVGGAFP